jgi:hypothetical protein
MNRGCLEVESGRYRCLDVLRVSSAESSKVYCDCAILLEIWDTGGLLQTSDAITKGSVLNLASPQGCVRAKVNSCTTDAYGCLVEITVDPASNWFPAGYNPPYLKPYDAA